MTRTRPNILTIVSHDLGRHLGCYGIPQAGTPNIDRLAAGGVRLDSLFSTSPQCSPARASLFTGRYPHSHGVIGISAPVFQFDLNPDEEHLSTLLHRSGYRTFLAGFQHETLRPHELPFEVLTCRDNFCANVAESVATHLRSESARSGPFYLQVGWTQAHRPFERYGTKPYVKRGVYLPPWIEDEPSAREDFAAFQGSIHQLDAAVGRIVETLEKTGLASNTLLIVLSDHGIPFPRAKHSLYEPGCEIAGIIRWPAGRWYGGKVYSELLSGVDLLPTLLEVAGAPIPANVQGHSFRSLLDGENYQTEDAIFTEQNFNAYPDVGRAVRTRRSKLIANFSPGRAFYDSSQLWRPLTSVSFIDEQPRTQHPSLELYDLQNDPLETTNLADSPRHRAELRLMAGRLHRWMRATDDPLLHGLPEPPIYQRTSNLLRELSQEQRTEQIITQ